MKDEKRETLSPAQRLLGLAALLAVIAGSIWLGLRFARPAPLVTPPSAMGPLMALITMGLGLVLFVIGAALYGLVLVTGCFTVGYSQPILRGLKVRVWLANLIVGVCLQSAFALLVGPTLLGMVVTKIPPPIAIPVCFFGLFILAQFLLIWFQIWAPLERIIAARRLSAQGIPASAIRAGLHIGLSDPTRSSFKKFGGIEDDFGMLWFGDDRLDYRGDSMAWQVKRGQLLTIERKSDAGATSSYFGAVHVLIRFLDETGREQYWRLHAEENWTMTSRARALDRLAAALESWQEGLNPILGSQRVGFEVG